MYMVPYLKSHLVHNRQTRPDENIIVIFVLPFVLPQKVLKFDYA